MTGTERLAALARGENPACVAQMKSGFAVMADSQYFPGYCILLAYPEASHLSDLSDEDRAGYLLDMSLLGEAIHKATGCKRINYSILANLDPFVHAHVVPRYTWESAEWATRPHFDTPAELRDDPVKAFDLQRDRPLMEAIRTELAKARSRAGR